MTADVSPPVRPATLEDVAAVAGVSRATVSRVINGATTVDPALRRVVEEAVVSTGYVPHRAARSLVTRRTDSIAVVVSERERRPVSAPFVGRMFSDPYFGRVVSGLLEVLRPAGIQMVLMLADDEPSRNQLLSYLRQFNLSSLRPWVRAPWRTFSSVLLISFDDGRTKSIDDVGHRPAINGGPHVFDSH
ncbi:regulatory protein, lacI family [Streptomyces sp. MnatMP-M27]|nr:regulatory protein, lacI family [Streptomyces sp. MnatMP-M27]